MFKDLRTGTVRLCFDHEKREAAVKKNKKTS